MRYDAFIIWGNGINFILEIVNIIDRSDNFKIIYEKLIEFDNYDFINDIYSCDSVPVEHLISKNEYLFKYEKKIYFILVENKKPKEKIIGEGQYRHIQCEEVNRIKIDIRNMFNIQFEDSEKQIFPLNNGVSHEHVLHATDYESQVKYLLDYLKLPSLSYFMEFSNKIDIKEIFINIPVNYVIVRMRDYFPNYNKGDDIDILCEDVNMMKDYLINIPFESTVSNISIDHIHYDIYIDELELRLDLFQKCSYGLRNDFEEDIFDTKKLKFNVFVPRDDFDLAIRYMEYLYKKDKKWHLEKCLKGNFEHIINKYLVYGTRFVNIQDLLGIIIINGEKINVELSETPHYKFLLGDKDSYIEYIKSVDQPNHTIENYENLILNFNNYGQLECELKNRKYIIHDGLHRACILKYKGVKKVKIKFLKNEQDNEKN